eukprot:4638748-Amphidinium_carterae.1
MEEKKRQMGNDRFRKKIPLVAVLFFLPYLAQLRFGLVGDVTAWRDVDEETEEAEAGPGGPPPN